MKHLSILSLVLFSILFAATFLSSCKTQEKSSLNKNENLNTLGISEKSEKEIAAEEKYIEATKMEMLGNHQQALNLYAECLKGNPDNDAVYYEMAKIYFEQNDYNNCFTNIKNAVKLNASNKWYQELYAEALSKTGNQKGAASVYEKLVKQYPDNIDYYFDWAFFLGASNQLQEAISAYNMIESKVGVEEQVSMEKERLYLSMGKPDRAAAEIEKLAATFPDEPKYLALLADLYSTTGNKDKAMQTLQKLAALDPNNPNTQLALADYYRRNNQDDKAFEAMKKVFESPEMNIDVKVQILVGYIPFLSSSEKRKSEALKLGEIITNTHPADPKSFAMYGDILSQIDQYNEALKQYQSSIRLDNGKFLVWQQVLMIEAHLSLYDSLINDANRCAELFPDQGLPYYMSGVANQEKKNYEAAIKGFSHAVTIGSDDNKFMSQLYASLGDAYNKTKNYSASDSCYEMSLVSDPLNSYTMNNYAYYLSLRGEKLTRAESLAKQAVDLDPGNTNNMDTYGWVLYKEKKFTEAKTWIEKALKNGAERNGVVLEHYGDVLYQMGDVTGAVEYWQKAKDNNVESENINKKIADKKLYE